LLDSLKQHEGQLSADVDEPQSLDPSAQQQGP
jgi:hypothetical protein